MSERTITIPFEEYEELQTFKSMAQKEDMKVYIKYERYEFGQSSRLWQIYTKDKAVRRLSDELIKTRNELEELKDEQEKEKKNPSTGRAILNIALFGILLILLFLIFK